MSKAIATEVRGAVLLVTLNRPEARNALNLELVSGLCDSLERLDADPTLRTAVLTGAGPGFCAGMDLKAFGDGEPVWEGGADGPGLKRVLTEPMATKPVIAAIEGFAVAGGLELALACDFIVSGRSAKFGVPEVQRSLVAIGGALRRLPDRIGPGLTKRLALSGDLISAADGQRIGLVEEVVEDGMAADAAMGLAQSIGRAAPLAVLATKRILDRQHDLADAEFWSFQEAVADPVFASRDAKEGAQAFADKREPRWTGS
ncbi:MAG: crotonase/enoyl-CoA hydratase family protein [Actinobacteria bacterium]|nr:crotonase/enoyl-CoA hydratase family protein [Actinomycetota bacterium]